MSILNLDTTQLSLLPTPALQSTINAVSQQKQAINTSLAYKIRRKNRLTGNASIYSPVDGRSVIKGFNTIDNAITAPSKLSLPAAATGDTYTQILGTSNPVVTNDPKNDGTSPSDYDDAAEALRTNLDSFYEDLDSQTGDSLENHSEAASMDVEINALRTELISANSFIEAATSIIHDRAKGLQFEPDVNLEALTPSLHQKTLDHYNKFVDSNIVLPFRENLNILQAMSVELQVLDLSTPPPLFDLTYGPPISVKGQFVLSRDGLYYDSRSGGLPEVSGVVLDTSAWELEYAPNLGGKGIQYDNEDFENIKNTILSYNFISDSNLVLKYYNSDDIIQNLEKNKSFHIDVVSGQITDLIASGFSVSSAMVLNYYNTVGAVTAAYDKKIRKRKKQVQLVALFASGTYSFTDSGEDPLDPTSKNLGIGDGVLIENRPTDNGSTYWTPIERVPVNDFSFLKGKPINFSLDDQKGIVLFSEDLEDTILPVQPKFLVSAPQPFSVLDKFSISPVPKASFPHTDGESHVSGTGPVVMSLSDEIITDSLVVGYNFLRPKVVKPDSLDYNVDNFAADSSGFLNAQLVGSSVDYVFPSGLSIPYLRGTYYNMLDTNSSPIDSTVNGGSYVALPTNKLPSDGSDNIYTASTLNQLTYEYIGDSSKTIKGGGFSFDFWIYVPDLTVTDNHRYRVIVANENSGGNLISPAGGTEIIEAYRLIKNPSSAVDDVTATDRVHGLVIGFRDRGGISTPSGLEFFILPTVSQNCGTSDRDWSHSVCFVEDMGPTNNISSPIEVSSLTESGIKLTVSSTSSNGVSMSDVSSNFVHMGISFDYVANLVYTYMDGELMASSNFASSLMLGSAESLMVPTLTESKSTSNNWNYKQSWNNAKGNGPEVFVADEGGIGAFTPWVLGGGYTDGVLMKPLSDPITSVNDDIDPGFLGYNTNDSYWGNNIQPTGSTQKTQHGRSLPLLSSNSEKRWSSGLDGFLGSFKIYGKPLSNIEIKKNFDAQKAYFKNIKIT